MTKIAFIGLGVMGSKIAAHLQVKGNDVTVYNRTTERAKRWRDAYGGHFADTPREAVKDADFVITCVGNDDDLRSVILSESGAFAGMKTGSILIDHTTASAQVARELFSHAEGLGLGFLDAPVSGGQRGAEEGTLAVMVGGRQDHYAKAESVMSAYSRIVMYIGDSGAGQQAKMVNQICIAGLVQALSEGLAFGKLAGLDMKKVLAVISKGAAASWQLDNRAETMLKGEFGFGFAVDWMRKDLGMCLSEAENINVRLPITALIDQFYADIQANGGGRFDTSSLITRLL
jgi:3-hydroxyisobutyrate dehydrogenase